MSLFIDLNVNLMTDIPPFNALCDFNECYVKIYREVDDSFLDKK